MNKPTIFITGGAGMIAYHVIKQLITQYGNLCDIIAIDKINKQTEIKQYHKERITLITENPNIKFIEQNLSDPTNTFSELLDLYNPFVILHLAATAGVSESSLFPEKVLTNNQNSFLTVVEKIRIYNPSIPIIYASSSSVYGDNKQFMSSENDILNPLSAYALSKLSNEQTAKLYSSQYNMNFIGLRFFTAYGEYNRKDMFLFKLLESIRYDTPVTLYNNGKMKRDFTYCGDIAQVIYYFIDQAFEYNIKRHEIYNLGGGATIEINYAVELLTYHFNKAPNIILNNHIPSHDPTITYCNNEKLMSLSDNNFNFTSFEQGIEILSQWYKKTLD